MKAINHYIVVQNIKEGPKTVAGLIMTDNTDSDNRYLKAKIISTGNLVEGLKDGDVVSGDFVNMIDHGIIDPVLVTKSALKNAVSVVSTIISADCVISNMRTNESDQ